jgi:hypothetical protein
MRKSKMMLIGIVCAAFMLNLSAQETTKEFRPTKDTWITNEKQGTPGSRADRGYGACKYLSLDTQSDGDKSHILLEFDLKDIPKGAKIGSAFLVMGARIDPQVGSIKAIEIRRLLKDDWQEGKEGDKTHVARTATSWMARSYSAEGESKWEKPGAVGDTDCDTTAAVTVQESEIKSLEADGLDILDLLNAWNKDRNVQFGLLIRTTNDKINYLRWNSSNAGEGKGPKLVIMFTDNAAMEAKDKKDK